MQLMCKNRETLKRQLLYQISGQDLERDLVRGETLTSRIKAQLKRENTETYKWKGEIDAGREAMQAAMAALSNGSDPHHGDSSLWPIAKLYALILKNGKDSRQMEQHSLQNIRVSSFG